MIEARTRTVAPTVEPVTLEDAKAFCRISDETSDAEVASLIAVARDRVENECEIALLSQTWQVKFDEFVDEMYLPRPPLRSVSSITYLDGSGVSQTLSSSVYTVDTTSKPGRVLLAYGQSWPATYGVPQAVTVTYLAGFGTAASSVPAALVHAVRELVATYHEHREMFVVGTSVAPMPEHVMHLLHAYRVPEAV